MYSTMIIQYVPTVGKRGPHFLCATHGVNKRICRLECKVTGGTIVPRWLITGDVQSLTTAWLEAPTGGKAS